MSRTIGKLFAIAGASLLIVGCSSHRYGSESVSYVEPAYSTPVYDDAHRTYTGTAYRDSAYEYNRAYTTTKGTYTSPTYTTPTYTTPAYTTPPPRTTTTTTTTPPRTTTTRTVAMAVHPEVTFDEFRTHMRNQSAIIVDAREAKHFAKGHVRGALNVPVGDEDAYIGRLRREVGPDQLIIIYCGGPDCPAGETVFNYLNSQGFTNLRIYVPGWEHLSKTDMR